MDPLSDRSCLPRTILLWVFAAASILTLTATAICTLLPIERRDIGSSTNNTLSNLTTRSTDWDTALYHGNWLLCIMNSPSQTITQSPWIVHNALQLHGWTSTTQSTTSQDALSSLGLDDAFHGLGIDADYRNWVTVGDIHDKSKGSWRATMGKYLNTFSKKDGVIVARNNYSPDWQAGRKGIPKEQVPPLKQWSDVVYLEWLKLAGGDRNALRGLKHVFRYNIANQETQRILRLAMGKGDVGAAPETPGKWPGSQWSIDEDSAKVALSTRNSVGVAYFWAQHKEQLGTKIIDQVNVFNCRTGPADQWCLYFHVMQGPMDKESLG